MATTADAHSADEKADQLRREMAMVRRELGADIKGVSDQAKKLTDWRSYVRDYPWAGIALAVAAGYMAVPRKLNVDTVDPETVARLAKQRRIVVESKPKAAAEAGFGSTMFRLASGIVLRTAIGFAAQKVADMVGQDRSTQPSPQATQQTGSTGATR